MSKKLYFIIPILIALLCGCGKNIEVENREQDNYNNHEIEEVIIENVEEEIPSQEISNSNESGNNYGNLANGGYAAYNDGYIYYVNGIGVGGTSDGKLYRVNSDWTETTKIVDDKAQSINIVGDWIYYINKSDNYKLYKARKDGTQKMMLSEERCNSIHVKGDWIYYGVSYYIKGESIGELYKMKTDGSNRQKISDDYVINIIVEDEWIYCRTETYIPEEGEYKYFLHKIKTDGTEKIKLSDEKVYIFTLYDQWIYYVNGDRNLCKIDIDGNNKSIITEDEVLDFNIDGEWIYYRNLSDYDNLYIIKPDGSSKEKISEGRVSGIHFVGDWIYYTAIFAEDVEPYRIKLDGTEKSPIVHLDIKKQDMLKRISILNGYWEKQADFSLSDEERIRAADNFITCFKYFLQDEYTVKLSDEEFKEKFPLMSVVETKTCPDSGISIRLFRFFGLDGIYGKSSMYTTFIQWWDDNGVNSQVLYEIDSVIVSDFMIVEDEGNVNIVIIGCVNLYIPAPLCFATWQMQDGIWKETKAIEDIKADEEVWMIDNQDTIVIVENKRMDYVLYQINKEKTGFTIYLENDESKKINFKFVGSSLVQE